MSEPGVQPSGALEFAPRWRAPAAEQAARFAGDPSPRPAMRVIHLSGSSADSHGPGELVGRS